MQYADEGNLRKYLKDNFETLTWNSKIKLAYQIAEGVKYLHGEKVFHRNLHPKNIVIHQGEAKIIDLSIAKSTEIETDEYEMAPYIDPKHFCKYDDKSDIYSRGPY